MLNLFSASRAAMAAAMAFMQRDRDIPLIPDTGEKTRKSRRTEAWSWRDLEARAREAVILNPRLAPAPKPRLRPGVKSKIFRA